MTQKTFIVTELSDLDAIAQWILDESVNVGNPNDQAISVTVCMRRYVEEL